MTCAKLDATRARLSTSSAAGFPVKTSPSRDAAQDSRASDPDSSTSSRESQTSLFAQEDGSWSKMSPVCSVPKAGEISLSFSRRWPTSGFLTSPTELWTLDSSEFPSGGGVCSSLRDVLVGDVPPRFYLSQRAAAGILRRAAKRGRELPVKLHQALQHLASGGGLSRTLTGSGQRLDGDTETFVVPDHANALRAEGHDASEDGTGRQPAFVVTEREST